MAYGLDFNIDRLLDAMDVIIQRLTHGDPLKVRDWAQLAVIVYKILRENDQPLVGASGEQNDAMGHVQDDDIGHDRIYKLANQVNTARMFLGQPKVEWKPDGSLLKQLLPLILQLLPLLIKS